MALSDQILLLVILLFFSGFFSGAEIALVSLSRLKAKHMLSQKQFGAKYVFRLKEDPQRMLATILIANNLVNVAAAAITTSIALQFFGNYAVGIATGVMTLLILIFGEITPKSIAANKNERVSQIVAGPIWYLSIGLAPILNILDTFLNKFLNLTGIGTKPGAITQEEIKIMVKTAVEEGSMDQIENKLIKNIFDFEDISVGEIITPRTDMAVINSGATVKHALELIIDENYSRLPVFEKHRDNIVGIVYLKDMIRVSISGKHGTLVKTLMKKPYFIPETMKISKLLTHFQRRKEHMAIVVDEHGSVSGIVTLEDVLEEIVGEIQDETDAHELHIKKVAPQTWIVNGKVAISEVNEKIRMRIKEGDYDTFGGFVMDVAGKIPKEKDVLTYSHFNITVEEIEGHRIATLRVEKKLTLPKLK